MPDTAIVQTCACCVWRNSGLSWRYDSFVQAQRPANVHEAGSIAGIQADHAQKLRMMLTALDTATVIEDMDIPGYRLHALKGSRQGLWSITVNKNWRVTFSFEHGDVYIVDYEDYH